MQRLFRRGKALIWTVAALCVSGCDLSEPFQSPIFPFLSSYDNAQPSTPVLVSNVAWWRGFEDQTLDQLITLALRDNLSLELARERVVAARFTRDSVPGAATVTPSARVQVSDASNAGFDITAQENIGLSWILDPYGTRRDTLRAADARIEVAEAEQSAAQLLLVLNITNAYVNLRHQQRILQLTHGELSSRQDTLRLTNILLDADAATRLEVTRSRARVVEIRAQLPALQSAITVAINEIAALTGAAPGDLPAHLQAALERSGTQVQPGISPDVGIPADLLRNRPDIHIAEREYYAAVAQIGVARAALYPRLSLSGTISLDLLGTSSRSSSYVFGPSVQFPAFPQEAARAGVEVQHSNARQAHILWRTAVLDAVTEVENALVEYDGTVATLQSAKSAARLYGEALRLTQSIFREGEATLSELILAQQALAQSQQTLAEIQRRNALGFIALNISLGSGHTVSYTDSAAQN